MRKIASLMIDDFTIQTDPNRAFLKLEPMIEWAHENGIPMRIGCDTYWGIASREYHFYMDCDEKWASYWALRLS